MAYLLLIFSSKVRADLVLDRVGGLHYQPFLSEKLGFKLSVFLIFFKSELIVCRLNYGKQEESGG